MDLRGPNDHLTNLGETTIIRVFKSALNRTGVEKHIPDLTEEEILTLTRVVVKILEEIEINDGKVCDADKKCIVMKIKCTSCRGLLKLLEYLESKEFEQQLLDLALTLKKIFKGGYHITFGIIQDSLQKILDALRQQQTAMEPSQIRPEVLGAEKNTEPIFSAVESKNIVNEEQETETIDSNLAKENDALLDEIIEVCEFSECEDTNHVILLIGTVGAGKSSLINTLHKVLTGRYYIIAKQGRGVSQSVTGELIRYNHCGISLESVSDVHKQRKIGKIFKKLPQIVDFAGLGNVNSPELSEILELLIGGFLPTGTAMKDLEAKQKDYGVGAPKIVYPTVKHEWKVSKIIFMHSCTDTIPDNLIDCIKGVLDNVDKVKGQLKYKPEIFLLTSKFDLAGDSSIHPIHSSSLKTLEDFEEVENKMADKFNIANRSFRWISITDSVSVDSLYIHKFALKFLKSLLEPSIPVPKNEEDVFGKWKNVELVAMKLYNQFKHKFLFRQIQLHITPAKLLAILISFVAVLLAVWYSK